MDPRDDSPSTLTTEDRPVSDLPRNRQAEQAVIGAALLSPTTLKELLGMIEPGDLYEISHEIIWGAIERLAARGKPVDAVSVAAELGRDAARLGREMGETAGPVYLHTCMGAVPNAASGPYYAELLKDYAYARRVVSGGIRLAQMGRTEIEDDLKAAVRRELQAIAEADRRGWDEPIPLRSDRALPAFPLTSLPTWLHDEVEAVAHETQTPPDLAATVALSVLATAAGGKIWVDVRPGVRWSEPTNLYTVAALPPGTRKSPVFKAMLKPLLAAEKQLRENAAADIIAKTVARKVAEEAASRSADAAAKASAAERPGALLTAQADAETLAATRIPAEPQLIAGNATVEEISSLLAAQGGRLAILAAESEIFSIMAGRYSGGQAAIEVFLYGHAGDEMRTNRKSRAKEQIDEPALTLGICTQPATLATLGGIEGSDERGLFARFLYTIPEVRIGYRDPDPTPRDPAIHETYHANIKALTLSLANLKDPIRLTLSPKAQEMQAAISADYEKRLRPDADLAGIVDWAGKAVGACMRIAGLLHLAEHLKDGYAKPISFETVTAAYELIDYYTQHALAAYDAMAADTTAERARALLTWIRNTGAARFTARDAFRNQNRNRFPKMADLDTALTLLEQHGYLRRLPAPPTAGRGRPQAPVYETHPTLTGT
ncbi:MAG TPA: DUF3987 domain-containing protein [Actinospica sp.]|jgi:hypothetical protein|nr:DUF3987 domain-containing protein [Actinospica sp.]